MSKKEHWMDLALKEAGKAYELGEVPVGAVVVKDDILISKAHNLKETRANPLGHAEILAIQKASKKLNRWRLSDCDLFVTLEPCLMCAGALIHARFRKIYIATPDPKTGAVVSLFQILGDPRLNHQIEFEVGLRQNESSQLLKEFFKSLRNKKSK